MPENNPKLAGADESGPASTQPEIVLNDREAHAGYANFARVTATPEEVIIDFGLNPNPFVQGKHEVKINQRLVVNFFTAKRLCRALLAALQRIETSFGPIELDVHRRIQGGQAQSGIVGKLPGL